MNVLRLPCSSSDLWIERTQAGLKRVRAEGKAVGRPASLTSDQQDPIRRKRADGISLGVLVKEFWREPLVSIH